MIAKLEVTDKVQSLRIIASNLAGDKQRRYDESYCASGDMEIASKKAISGAVCRSDHHASMLANQFRLVLSSLDYVLMEGMRRRVWNWRVHR